MVQIVRRQDPLGDLPGIFQKAFESATAQAQLDQRRKEDQEFQIRLLTTQDMFARQRMKDSVTEEESRWQKEQTFKKMQSEKDWIGKAMMGGLIPGAEGDKDMTGPYGKSWKLPEGAKIPDQFTGDFFTMQGTRPGDRPQVLRKPQPSGYQPQTKEEAVEFAQAKQKPSAKFGPKTWDPATKSYLQQNLTSGEWKSFGKAPGDPSKTAPPEVAKAQSLVMGFAGGIDAQMAMMLTINPELMGNPEIMSQIKGSVPPHLQPAYDNAVRILSDYYQSKVNEHFIYKDGQLQKVSP